MSKLILVFLSMYAYLSAFEAVTYEKALALQEKNHKTIMLDAIRTDCHYCSDMDKEVFDDKDMQVWLEERFIFVKINLDEKKMPLGIKPVMTPSFYFLNQNQEIVKQFNGAWNIADFKDLTRNIK